MAPYCLLSENTFVGKFTVFFAIHILDYYFQVTVLMGGVKQGC